jgi:lipopolysaccharide export system permease protein
MLFHSSLRKELARSFGATLIVLTTVIMTMTLIRTLGQASRGSFNPSDVVLVMGYTVLAYMPTILTMSLFIGIIATLSRMYRDSEMVIWFTSGQGLAALMAPLFRFAWPVLLVVTSLATLVLPWSNQKIENLKEQYEKRSDIERIEPGQFQESSDGKRVFFVDKAATAKLSGSNVFIVSLDNGKESMTSARSGRIQTVGKDRFLFLENGQRLENLIASGELKLSEFETYQIKIGTDLQVSADTLPVNTRPTLELLGDLTLPNLAELSWRFGLILAAINFVIIGIAVSSVNPRVGRGANLVFSLFAFVLYYNLLNLGQNWISSARFGFGVFFLGLHGSAFVLGALWLARGHYNWHWHHLFGARPSATTEKKSPSRSQIRSPA